MLFLSTNKLQSFRYAPPCIAIWALYLLAFWPGLMSPDSIAQWDQVVKTSFSNNYPAFHTLTNWLITRIWLSPATIAAAQIIALAGVFSLTISELGRWGISGRVRAWVTAVFCLSPVNGMMVITLWKDIPYSCAMLGLFTVVLRSLRSDGCWLRSAQGMVALWSTVVLLSLYRHNGVPVVVLALTIMMIVWRRCSRELIRVGLNWLLFLIIVTGPVYRLIGVVPMAKFFALQNVMHQVGAMITHGVIRSNSDLSYLASIQPIDSWLHYYDCYSLNGLVYNGNVRHQFMESNGDPILGIWWRSIIQNPGIVLAHQKCVTSILWRIDEPRGRYGHLYTTERGIVENDLGLQSHSLWPRLRDFIYQAVDWSLDPQLIWFTWRPAIYFYALLLCVGLAAVRTKNLKVLLVGAPAVLNALIWFPLITTQDFRFQYPVYVMALIVPALLFVPRPAQKIEPTTLQ
jgi:hypothetical protein